MTPKHYADIYEEVNREYEKIRNLNESARQEAKKQIYSHFPRIKEIDDELANIAMDACKSILSPTESAKKVIESMKKKTDSLTKEKEKILKSAGVSPDFLSEAYNCEKCRDTGWCDNKRCECYAEKVQKIMQKHSNISAGKMHSFKDFDLKLYPTKVDDEYEISPRDCAKGILETARRYSTFDDSVKKQLLFYGGTGLGKTFTSECIAREFMKNGKSVFYTSAPRLFSIFEDYKFGKNTSDEIKNTIDYIYNAELLIIDDLGTEFRNQYTDSILFDIINARTSEDRPLIISTNLNLDQLGKAYSQRILSRVLGYFEHILFLGDDIRTKN